MKKFFYYIFCCSLFFFLSCIGNQEGDRTPERRERQRDSRGDLNDRDNRDSEIQRLKGGDRRIDSKLDRRYDGGFYYEDYDGKKCSEDEDCMDICDSRRIPRASRRKCYSSPKALIENIEDGFRTLVSIETVEDLNMEPALLAGILDLSVEIVVELVEEKMSVGDLKSFLAWVAVREDIAEVFLEEDRRSKVMEEAFKALGDLQPDARKEEETGLNMGLVSDDDSFFYLAAQEGNEAAFQIAYDVLDSACSSRDCKMDILCARELKTRRRSRVFGRDSSILDCKTAASQGRRSRREETCYVHGAASWSYLNDLIESKDIRDRDFEGREKEVTVEACNKHCGGKNEKKCERVQ